jgi:hypothetical protein
VAELSRRTLLQAAAVATAVVPAAGLLATREAGDLAYSGRQLTRDLFAPHKGTLFSLRGELAGTRLRLVDVTDLSRADAGSPGRFSLIFRVDQGDQPAGGTWVTTHPEIGKVSLFITPVGRRGDVQAVFNAE